MVGYMEGFVEKKENGFYALLLQIHPHIGDPNTAQAHPLEKKTTRMPTVYFPLLNKKSEIPLV